MRCAQPAHRRPRRGCDSLSRPATVLQRLIVTRPAVEALGWVEALRAQGWPATALPLIQIAEPSGSVASQALQRSRAQWAAMDAIMFVSGAAVSHFFAHGVPVASAEVQTRFWAPGPGTARVLAQRLADLGLDPGRIDAPPADAPQFDSEALWPVVAMQVKTGCRILVVRGVSVDAAALDATQRVTGHGRDWLIRRCEAAGAKVQTCVAYERRAPVWTDGARALAMQAQDAGSVWLFSSSEALEHLLRAHPRSDWSRAEALVTHPRIAERARKAGFGRVVETRPALADLLRTLESGWSRP